MASAICIGIKKPATCQMDNINDTLGSVKISDSIIISSRPIRLCFHCGQPGHNVSSCSTSRTPETQTADGRDAFQRYLVTKSNRSYCQKRVKEKKVHHHHFDRVVEWMKDSECVTDQCDNDYLQPKDPFAILEKETAVAASHDGKINQRWNELHSAKYRSLVKAHRTAFEYIINDVRKKLATRLNVTPSDEAASKWQMELNQAVVLGRPADFSNNDNKEESSADDGRCIKVYAVEKLHPRCRHLHHLLFHDNAFSNKIRSRFLLPVVPQSDADTTDDGVVNVISIGGGPGYDHAALCLIAKFLYDIQPFRSKMRMRSIRTHVYDLFDQDWKPIMSALGECFHERLHTNNGDSDKDLTELCGSGSSMTMHHADLRQGLDESIHNDLRSDVESADIIIAQFVLHENSSFILKESDETDNRQQRIRGAIRDMLARASIGAVMICTDSSNTLFPALKETASEHGWVYLGDKEQRGIKEMIAFSGPKSYVILERIRRD